MEPLPETLLDAAVASTASPVNFHLVPSLSEEEVTEEETEKSMKTAVQTPGLVSPSKKSASRLRERLVADGRAVVHVKAFVEDAMKQSSVAPSFKEQRLHGMASKRAASCKILNHDLILCHRFILMSLLPLAIQSVSRQTRRRIPLRFCASQS